MLRNVRRFIRLGAMVSLQVLVGAGLLHGQGVSFIARRDFSAGTAPVFVAAGDFNGDGKLDLAVSSGTFGVGIVSVLLGNGDGSFQPALSSPAGNNPGAIAVGDFNGDAKLDLVVTNLNTNNVSLLLGNGDGTFQAPRSFQIGRASCRERV